jgi:cholesterol oxidase
MLVLFIYEDFNDLANSSFDNSMTANHDSTIKPYSSHVDPTGSTTARQGHLKAIAKLLKCRSAKYLEKGLIEYRQQEHSDQLYFAFASCQYPPGVLYNNLAYQSWRRLSLKLDDRQAHADLLLLLGDQIYSDPTAGLFDPKSKEGLFYHPYQQWLHHTDVRSVLRRLPSYMMLDDHEIRDNWVKDSPEPDNDWRFGEGVKAYIRYQRQENLKPGQALWLEFQKNGFPFFMADTRTGRELRNASNIEQKHIISEPQFSVLGNWIKANKSNNGKPMFISSAAILLPRHILSIADNNTSAIRSDSWDGYPASLHRLLALLADEQVNNVIFLSGDEHLAAVARISIRNRDTGHQAVTHSIHSSSLHAPFPFANGQPEQLQSEDSFSFHYSDNNQQRSNHYECIVSTELVVTGDGFTLLRASKQQGQWQLECTFDRETGANTINKPISIVL